MNSSIRKILAILVVFALFAGVSALYYFFHPIRLGSRGPAVAWQGVTKKQIPLEIPEEKFGWLKIGEKEIRVEFARTEAQREQGLSGTDSLNSDDGLFFVFEQPNFYGFWMKDMKYPLDIIWLDENLRVDTVWQGIRPDTYPEIFYPTGKSEYVLEVNAGFAENGKINVGTLAEFIKN